MNQPRSRRKRNAQRRRRDRQWDAERIRQLRAHLGLTQADLADELNTRQQTISEWERGQYQPRGPAARLLTRVAEDARFGYQSGADANPDDRKEADSDA